MPHTEMIRLNYLKCVSFATARLMASEGSAQVSQIIPRTVAHRKGGSRPGKASHDGFVLQLAGGTHGQHCCRQLPDKIVRWSQAFAIGPFPKRGVNFFPFFVPKIILP